MPGPSGCRGCQQTVRSPRLHSPSFTRCREAPRSRYHKTMASLRTPDERELAPASMRACWASPTDRLMAKASCRTLSREGLRAPVKIW